MNKIAKRLIAAGLGVIVSLSSLGSVAAASETETVQVTVQANGNGSVYIRSAAGEKENGTVTVAKGENISVELQAQEGAEISGYQVSAGDGTVLDNGVLTQTSSYVLHITAGQDLIISAQFTQKETETTIANETEATAEEGKEATANTVSIGGIEVPEGLAAYIGLGRGAVAAKPQRRFRSAGDTVRVTPGASDAYGSWATNHFTVTTPEGNFVGVCAEPNSGTPSGNYSASILNNDFIKWCLIKYTKDPQVFGFSGTVASSYAALHAIIGYVYTGQTTGLGADAIQTIQGFLTGAVGQQIQTEIGQGIVVFNDGTNVALSDYECYVALNRLQDIVWVQESPKGQLQLLKKSSNPEISDNNACYSLEGAVYTIYSDPACTTVAGTLTTNAAGETAPVTLKPGTYYVKETKAPKGYGLDSMTYTCTVQKNQVTMVNDGYVTDAPQDDPIDIALKKIDKETGEAFPVEKGSLAGAEYTYRYYANMEASGEPTRTWVFKTDDEGKIKFRESYLKEGSDQLYKNGLGGMTVPLGSLTVQETKAPKGYLLDSTVYTYKIIPIENHATTIDKNGNKASKLSIEIAPTVEEQVKRGDISFNKISKEKQDRMAGVVFKVTAEETGESHEIMTDENGYWSSESSFNLHSQDTNGGKADSGTWFGTNKNGTVAPVNDQLGAFPFGTYKFEEQKTAANKGKKMITFSVTVSRDKYTVEAGTKSNENEQPITIHTKASVDGAKEVEEGKVVTITDTCTMEGLVVGKKYRLDGLQKLKEEKATLIIAGKEVTGSTEFEATTEKMEVEVKFTVDTTGLGGKSLVTFEKLYDLEDPKEPVATHEDYEDEGQTIKVKKDPGTIITSMPNEMRGGSSVKTGDTNQFAAPLWLMLFGAALSGFALLLKKQYFGMEAASMAGDVEAGGNDQKDPERKPLQLIRTYVKRAIWRKES